MAIDIGEILANLNVNSGNLEKGLAQARVALNALERETKILGEAQRKGAIDAGVYRDRMIDIIDTTHDLTAAQRQAWSALGASGNPLDVYSKGMQEANDRTKNLGRAMLQLGYMADDVRYGFGAIVNNIGPLVLALSGNAGVAAAAQVAAVAAYELLNHWDKLLEAFGDTTGTESAMRSIEGMSKALKDLEAQVKGEGWNGLYKYYKEWQRENTKTLFGFDPYAGEEKQAKTIKDQLEKAQSGEAGFKAMGGTRTPEEHAIQKRFDEAVREAGGAKGADAIAERLAEQKIQRSGYSEAIDPKLKADYDRLEAMERNGTLSSKSEYQLGGYRMRAKDAEIERQKQRLGNARYNVDEQLAIASELGGSAGALISGDTETQREAKEREKEEEQEHKKAVQSSKQRQARDKRDEARAKRDEARAEQRKRQDEARERKADADSDQLARQLHAANFKGQDINDVADQALARGASSETTKKVLASRLSRSGMSREDADQAARRVVTQSKGRVADRGTQIQERLRNQSVEKATDAIPGLQDQIEMSIAGTLLQGRSPDQIKKSLAEHIQRNSNLTEIEANEAAGELTKKGTKSVREKIVRKQLNPDDPTEDARAKRKSEVFDTASLTSKIQGAIGGNDEPKKHTKQFDQIISLLAKFGGGKPTVT